MSIKNDANLRVLMVTTSFPVGPNRASGIFVKRLSDALSSKLDLTVLTPSAYEDIPAGTDYKVRRFRYAPSKWQRLAHEPGGIPVAIKANLWLILVLPIFAIAMFGSVLRYGRKVDVIHANWSISGLIAGLAALLIRKPVITTLRGSDVSSIRHSVISRILLALTLRLNRLVVAVSEAIASDVRRQWPARGKNIVVIPNGVDEGLLSLQHTQQNSGLTLLTVGNLIPLKDVGTLIRAFSKIQGDVYLRVVGEGVERQALEIMSEQLGISERVVFTGALPPEVIESELSMADIFVLSSHSEGRPNVILEAMAAGCAIVSSDLPGVRELINTDHCGLFFRPGDVEMLSVHIKRLIDSERLRLQMGKCARSRIIDMELTWSGSAACYAHLYKNLLEVC